MALEVCQEKFVVIRKQDFGFFFSLVAGSNSLDVFYSNCCDLCNENIGSVEENALFLNFFLTFRNLQDPRSAKSTGRVTVIPTVIT